MTMTQTIAEEKLNPSYGQLNLGGRTFEYVSLEKTLASYHEKLDGASQKLKTLPFSQKILLENTLRHGASLSAVKALLSVVSFKENIDINFFPARVLMQDFTGVPAIVDLAAMRDALKKIGGDPTRVNPCIPVDLVIDHSVIVDDYGNKNAFSNNVGREYERNKERYQFLNWGQKAFSNFRVVPPGTGICHQVNLEYLATVVFQKTQKNKQTLIYPDTLVGTDSHTTMVNGLSVLGWGVGGIEAEAAMLGQPLSMLIPEVVGFELQGNLREGMTATDLVLTITNILRAKGVVGKFVEFFGEGIKHLSLADRATIANMAPEYGATCGFFPIDDETLHYLRFTGRKEEDVTLVEAYAKAQGLWYSSAAQNPIYATSLSLDLSSVRPTLAGPKRPQDKIFLEDIRESCIKAIQSERGDKSSSIEIEKTYPVADAPYTLSQGDVVIAAITSCTNTSNPSVLMAAGLLARKAAALGLKAKPWVKTSLAPGSKVVMDYLNHADLIKDLEAVGFYLVGYGCTTCIGNSGPLHPAITKTVEENDMTVSAVLSGNRNFEGRVNPHVKANYLASPPLVVAYALAGTMLKDLTKDPLGKDVHGNDVYLSDIWPTNQEINDAIQAHMTPTMYQQQYAKVFEGDALWQSFNTAPSLTYTWDEKSTYVQHPPYFEEGDWSIQNINGARLLALLGDSVTTDHISPAGNIKKDSPAGRFLQENHVEERDFNAYGARRGNHDVMIRGTFANIRLTNHLLQNVSGGFTRHYPSKDQFSIYDAAMRYQSENIPLIVMAGKEYGTGSSRDWAAKGTRLLGVKAVIAESFERIHRSNLVGMGVLPLVFQKGTTWQSLGLKGDETFDLLGLENALTPSMSITLVIHRADASNETIPLTLLINTTEEVSYMKAGGILPYVARDLSSATSL